MCTSCFSFVQFPDILPSDINVNVNGGQYAQNASVQDLVDTNPQFWFESGISGFRTLTTFVKEEVGNITLSVTRGNNTVTSTGWFIKGRPNDR